MRLSIIFGLGLATAVGCGSYDTSLRVHVDYEDSWGLTSMSVAMRDTVSSVPVQRELELVVPDEWAGQPMELDISGSVGGSEWASGSATVVPELNKSVLVFVDLSRSYCDAGTACETPPEPQCLGNVLRQYAELGTCVANGCSYDFIETVCAEGCTAGACNNAQCDNDSCTNPPEDICFGNTVRQYEAVGDCVNGTCSYQYSDTPCEYGCSGGSCIADGSLVGTWLGQDASAEFNSDGTFTTWTDFEVTRSGEWFLPDASSLRLDDEMNEATLYYTFAITSNNAKLFLPAGIPIGNTTGIVGTWKYEVFGYWNEAPDNVAGGTETFYVKNDGSLQIEYTPMAPEEEPSTWTGTWHSNGGGYYTFVIEGDDSYEIFLADGAFTFVEGDHIYTRN